MEDDRPPPTPWVLPDDTSIRGTMTRRINEWLALAPHQRAERRRAVIARILYQLPGQHGFPLLRPKPKASKLKETETPAEIGVD